MRVNNSESHVCILLLPHINHFFKENNAFTSNSETLNDNTSAMTIPVHVHAMTLPVTTD